MKFEISRIIFYKYSIIYFMKIRPVQVELLHEDRLTHGLENNNRFVSGLKCM